MSKPLVSCICITQNRKLFLRQAIQYFFRAQHHCQLECELIIIDGSDIINLECVELATDTYADDIIYSHKPREPNAIMGKLRNEANQRARGDIILHWDDDDFQASDRIDKQVKALQYHSTNFRFVFTSQYYGYHLAERKAFRSRCWNDKGAGSMGGSFAYHRALWEQVPFRDVNQGEDTGFFEDCQKAKVSMVDMQDPNYYVYIRHNQNSSPHHNNLWDDDATASVAALLPEEDQDFYDELSEILPLAQWNHPTTFGQHGIYKNARLPQPNVHLGNRPVRK